MAAALIPYPDITTQTTKNAIKITAITSLKHAELFETVRHVEQVLLQRRERRTTGPRRKIAPQSHIARILGVTPVEFSDWLNFKSCPPVKATGRRWTEKLIARVEKGFWRLTGKTMEELFPEQLRANVEFLAAPKKFARTVEVTQAALEHYAHATRARFIAQTEPNRELDRNELHEKFELAYSVLSYKERTVLELRFGLTGKPIMTLEEVASNIGISNKERVRQIENAALNKLRGCKHTQALSDFIED